MFLDLYKISLIKLQDFPITIFLTVSPNICLNCFPHYERKPTSSLHRRQQRTEHRKWPKISHVRTDPHPLMKMTSQTVRMWTDSLGGQNRRIRKGRILAGLRDIWKVCLEILPLQQSVEKHVKTKEKIREALQKHIEIVTPCCLKFLSVFPLAAERFWS